MALPILQRSVSKEPEEICFPGFSSSGPGDADEEICKEIELKAFIMPKTDGMAVYITSQTCRVFFRDSSLQTALPHDRW